MSDIGPNNLRNRIHHIRNKVNRSQEPMTAADWNKLEEIASVAGRRVAELKEALADQKASHDSMAVVLCGMPTPQGVAACGKQCLKYSDKAAAAIAARCANPK